MIYTADLDALDELVLLRLLGESHVLPESDGSMLVGPAKTERVDPARLERLESLGLARLIAGFWHKTDSTEDAWEMITEDEEDGY